MNMQRNIRVSIINKVVVKRIELKINKTSQLSSFYHREKNILLYETN